MTTQDMFMKFNVTIEIPRGSRNKYELDHETGRIKLDRRLFTSTQYPHDYGFIDDTLGLDGDPLDALVLLDDPTFPSCLIECRAVAMLRMADEKGRDDKVLCVPAGDPRFDHICELGDVPKEQQQEIQHFFEVYKNLEPGKDVSSNISWTGRNDAEKEIINSYARLKEQEKASGKH